MIQGDGMMETNQVQDIVVMTRSTEVEPAGAAQGHDPGHQDLGVDQGIGDKSHDHQREHQVYPTNIYRKG